MDEQVVSKKLEDVKSWLQQEYAGIRTGQASPSLLDGVKVESYGTLVPLNQVGSVGIEDARTLRISPWDTSQVSAIEQAIREANLGISVMTDSAGCRVVFPELTSERRVQLLKLAKSKLEEARIRVRSVRDDVMKEIDRLEKAGDISEDERFARKEKIQTLVDSINKTLEQLLEQKEQELNK